MKAPLYILLGSAFLLAAAACSKTEGGSSGSSSTAASAMARPGETPGATEPGAKPTPGSVVITDAGVKAGNVEVGKDGVKAGNVSVGKDGTVKVPGLPPIPGH